MGKKVKEWMPPDTDPVVNAEATEWMPPDTDPIEEPLKKKESATVEATSKDLERPGKPSEKSGQKTTSTVKPGKDVLTKLAETIAAPIESFVRGSVAALTDMLPGSVAAAEAGRDYAKFDEIVVNRAYPPVSTPMGPVKTNVTDDMRKAAVDNYIKKVGIDQYNIEKDAYDIAQLRRRSELLKYSDEQEKEREETLVGTPQTTGEIKDIKSALQWLAGSAGGAIGTAPTVIAGPVFPFLMEKGEGYKSSLKAIEEKTGLTRDEILALDLDKAARENSTVSGAINSSLELVGTLAVFGRFVPKGVATKFISKVFTSKVGAPVTATLGEGMTEYIQALDTKIAEKLSLVDKNGKTVYKDVFDAVNAITPEEHASMREEFYAGMAGGGGVSVVGGLIEGQSRAEKLASIKAERAKTTKEVINDAQQNIDRQNPESIQSAADAIETKINEGTATTESVSEPVQQTAEPKESGTEATVQQDTDASGQGVTQEPAAVLEKDQQVEEETTVGVYTKKGDIWYFNTPEGTQVPVFDPSKPVTDNTSEEIKQLRGVLDELQKDTKKKVLSSEDRNKIQSLPRTTVLSRARGYFLDGGKIKWEGNKISRGAAQETGGGKGEKKDLRFVIDEKKGLSPEKIGERLFAEYGDEDNRFTDDDYKNAVLEILDEDRNQWYENQRAEEDSDFLFEQEMKREEAGKIQERLNELEAEEQGVQENLKQQYENERRVYPASEGEAGTGAAQQAGQAQESGAKSDAGSSIAGYGNKIKGEQVKKLVERTEERLELVDESQFLGKADPWKYKRKQGKIRRDFNNFKALIECLMK